MQLEIRLTEKHNRNGKSSYLDPGATSDTHAAIGMGTTDYLITTSGILHLVRPNDKIIYGLGPPLYVPCAQAQWISSFPSTIPHSWRPNVSE